MMGKTRRRMSMRMRTNSTGHMVVVTFSSTQREKMKILYANKKTPVLIAFRSAILQIHEPASTKTIFLTSI